MFEGLPKTQHYQDIIIITNKMSCASNSLREIAMKAFSSFLRAFLTCTMCTFPLLPLFAVSANLFLGLLIGFTGVETATEKWGEGGGGGGAEIFPSACSSVKWHIIHILRLMC